MGDFRGQHWEATHAAIDAVGVLQERLAMATEQSEVALGAVLACTGSTQVESGQNALNFLAGIKDRIEECFGVAEQAVAELQRYAGGF
jgi:hypothetical protein